MEMKGQRPSIFSSGSLFTRFSQWPIWWTGPGRFTTLEWKERREVARILVIDDEEAVLRFKK